LEKSKAAEKAYQLGKEYERTYRGCSQCVIAALQDTLDIRNDHIFKASTGLAGGTGLACDSGCGAYTGAVLVLGFLVQNTCPPLPHLDRGGEGLLFKGELRSQGVRI
jgi:hypothetical protein